MASFPKQLQGPSSISKSTNVGLGYTPVQWESLRFLFIFYLKILILLSHTEGLEFQWDTKVILQRHSSYSRCLTYLCSLMIIMLALQGSGVVNCWSVDSYTKLHKHWNFGLRCTYINRCILQLPAYSYSILQQHSCSFEVLWQQGASATSCFPILRSTTTTFRGGITFG